MDKDRVEAFSDGVLAIIITIMVLELKVPHSTEWSALAENWFVFLSYVLSFVFVGLYWINHHHLFQKVEKINNKILLANLLGLFWQSLIPFSTAWMGENAFQSTTVTLYASILTLSILSHLLLVHLLKRLHGFDSEFSRSFTGDYKIYLTLGVNLSAAIISFIGFPKIGFSLLILVALLWFIPSHRFDNGDIENAAENGKQAQSF
jgi:uncharacterized membrane protein